MGQLVLDEVGPGRSGPAFWVATPRSALRRPCPRHAWRGLRRESAGPRRYRPAGAGSTGAASTGRSVPRGTPKGAAGNTRRYFPFKLLVPPEAERAVSVFVYVDLGHKTSDVTP